MLYSQAVKDFNRRERRETAAENAEKTHYAIQRKGRKECKGAEKDESPVSADSASRIRIGGFSIRLKFARRSQRILSELCGNDSAAGRKRSAAQTKDFNGCAKPKTLTAEIAEKCRRDRRETH